MKIPPEEMPKRYGPWVNGDMNEQLDGGFVRFSDYQRLYNERRFIPVEECSPWISVKERLPEGSFSVLFYDRHAFRSMGKYEDGSWYATASGERLLDGFVTHWMPLPAPPDESEALG